MAMPEGSEILDIQPQDGSPIMYYLSDPLASMIEVRIVGFADFDTIPNDGTKYTYLATVQGIGHFFMNHEE